ncbi:DUF6328 family protein [Cryobacterium tagatosivorans]|jgi:hypothetical protein|uniref:Sodium:proton antiporter n=1 Tax=Cryobacterium tagatosivorans TaxID=1259199 RepID=A0A4V6QG21_9MICO|nr:DUF6328 family protein [Cryobacterium tagatosivorans]TFB49515.1 sodium:proton antiporter [Cryobacterium tagatosivorans]
MSEQPAAQADDRRETSAERLDRNWDSLLQELRVTQTGTQILGGFLLAVAFQPRFTELDGYQIAVYLALVTVAAVTTAVGLGPVSLHRMLFRRHAMAQIVKIGSALVRITLAGVAIVLTGTTLLIFDVVLGRAAGLIAAAAVLALTLLIWLIVPRSVRPDGP